MNLFRRPSVCLLTILVVVILFSPLACWLTGIGQQADTLSAQVIRLPDGTLVSSPKAQALHRLTLPLRVERVLVYPLLLLAFQFSGGALAWRVRLERLVGRRFRGSEMAVVLLFILTFHLALYLLYLPFNFYRGFVLMRQFGLSTQTAAGWLSDWGKSVLIALLTDGLLWTGFYWLLRRLPRRWPVVAGAGLLVFSLVYTLLTPVLITPLFYEVRPLEDAALRQRILALAGRAGMAVDRVEVIDASAKTTAVNAYFTGFGRARRIVLYDTLLAGCTPDQIEVVLAHEMGHWYYRHHLLAVLGVGAAAWLGLFGLRWLLNRTWPRLGLRGPADVAGLPYLLAVVAIASLLSLPVQNAVSRYAERQADRFALEVSQKPEAFVQLFEQFAEQNLSPVDAPGWEKFLFYTHPSIAERIRMAELWVGD